MSRAYVPQARAILQVVLDGIGGDDSAPLIVPVLPRACTVHRNSYRQADSWELEFDAADLGIDPALIRAGAVEIYLFTVAPQEEGERLISRARPDVAAPDTFRPRSPTDGLALEVGLSTSKQRFTHGRRPVVAGLFDEGSLELGDGGKWVRIQGQDYTALLASTQWKPLPNGRARRLPTGKRVDLILADMLAEADHEGRLSIRVRGIDPERLPVVGEKTLRNQRRGIPVEADTTVWDAMYQIATRHGLILFVDGLDVVLSRPRNLTQANDWAIRRLAWGKNLASLELSRKYGRESAPTIVVQGYDDRGRERIEVEYPAGNNVRRKGADDPIRGKGAKKETTTVEKHRVKTGTTAASRPRKSTPTFKGEEDYQIIPAYGITDRVVLGRMAEALYHLMGRAERKIVATTRDLRDLREADLLDLTSGDAVAIEWDPFDENMLEDRDLTPEQKAWRLVERGFNAHVAETIVLHHRRLKALSGPLRVREVSFDWSADDGIKIELELVEFIQVSTHVTAEERREARLRKADGSRVGRGPTPAAERAALKHDAAGDEWTYSE